MRRAVPAAASASANLVRSPRPVASTSQHTTPISIIERPMVLSTSTRSRSLLGAQPQAMRYSCSRKSSPKREDLGAAANGGSGDLRCGKVLAPQFLGHERERDSRKKQETAERETFPPIANTSRTCLGAHRRPATSRNNGSGTSARRPVRASSRCRPAGMGSTPPNRAPRERGSIRHGGDRASYCTVTVTLEVVRPYWLVA